MISRIERLDRCGRIYGDIRGSARVPPTRVATNFPQIDDTLAGMFGISVGTLGLMAAAGSAIDLIIVGTVLGVVAATRWCWRGLAGHERAVRGDQLAKIPELTPPPGRARSGVSGKPQSMATVSRRSHSSSAASAISKKVAAAVRFPTRYTSAASL
jgi:hypothetical protein